MPWPCTAEAKYFCSPKVNEMKQPPDTGRRERLPERPTLSPEDRRRVAQAALLRPVNVLILVVGAFATIFFSWWLLPLTFVTYALLVFLASRDPFFERQVLGNGDLPTTSPSPREVPPERRARWLPRGETRRKVEDALGTCHAVIAAIEKSDDVARAVLGDAIPKLHATADRLVEVAHKREKAAAAIAEIQTSTNTSGIRTNHIKELKNEIRSADGEIWETANKLANLRVTVVQTTIADAPESRAAAAELSHSLDELNLRLEALKDTISPRNEPPESP